jgi:hypothetical protein
MAAMERLSASFSDAALRQSGNPLNAASPPYHTKTIHAKRAGRYSRVQAAFTAIDTAHTEARETVDEARAASATLAIATALALLIGAFAACAAAVFGGRERDGLEERLAKA